MNLSFLIKTKLENLGERKIYSLKKTSIKYVILQNVSKKTTPPIGGLGLASFILISTMDKPLPYAYRKILQPRLISSLGSITQNPMGPYSLFSGRHRIFSSYFIWSYKNFYAYKK